MPNIALKDILISARQESYRMRHFYLGAEHLFIAMLELKGSVAGSILQDHGLTPEYVIDAIRRKVGKGSKHRLWAGIPNTPRADVLLGIANDLALENGREEINERDLLIALLEEEDSIAVRVLKALGMGDTKALAESARTYTLNHDSQRPYVRVDFSPEFEANHNLTKDQLFILRRMFYGYAQIRVEKRLTGGYSKATLLVVTPIHGDNRTDSSVVVKIDQQDIILDEAQRYESHIKGTLPALTARLEDRPVAPETSDLAGIKYTLVAGHDQLPHDLRAVLREWTPNQLGQWLQRELFPSFGRIWWQQKRPFRFQVWREYDWLLPPVLTLESIRDRQIPQPGHVLKFPMKRTKLHGLEYGDIVAVENFTVHKVYAERNTIQLAIGHGTDSATAYKIEVRGLDLTKDTYYRGEVVDSMIGRIYKTRNEQLIHAMRALEPDFDIQTEKISTGNTLIEKLPNPIIAYEELLDQYVNGALSTIHGDMHLGNIMIGPGNSAFLIDFAHTRDGHTAFDWATLEISLLSELVMPTLGETWEDARLALLYLIPFNVSQPLPFLNPATVDALQVVHAVREIAHECLASADHWTEYYIALAFAALRAMTWETMSIGSRRLMYLVSALAMHEIRTRFRASSETDTPSPDETDVTTRSSPLF
ncbi:MAG: Clp protease N-terminal domain-containing protein [bacterium]|nr:Clp protease N-terminal domain-containing protein [bacterium]